MKIVTFSDIHNQISGGLTEWFLNNPANLLLFAGDIQMNQRDISAEFIDWIHKLPYAQKIMTFGNHDGNSGYITNLLYNKKFSEITILNDESITIDGIKIFGSPYSVEFGNWWFMKEDGKLEKTWKRIPDDTNILITHGPPYGILDDTCEGVLAGSKTLLNRVLQLKQLKYHIFGHIHEAYGVKTIGNVTFMNVSLLNEKYQLTNNPVIIEYEAGSTETDYNIGE